MPRYQRQLTRHLESVLGTYRDAYIGQMFQTDARDTPSSPLFHYTTFAGFSGIMRSKSFWFTSIEQMNDTTELTYGFGTATKILGDAMLEAAKGTQPADWLVREFLKPLVQPGNLAGIRGRFEFYSASFGQADEPHQWIEYGDHRRGIAIGLSAQLFAPMHIAPNAEPHDHHFMGKVIYDPVLCETRHSQPIKEAIDILTMEAQRGSFPSGKQAQEFCRRLASEMHIPILWNSVTTKESKWEPEKETRLLALNDRVHPKLPVQVRAGGHRYVVIPLPLFDANIVTEVMVGPNADADTEARVDGLLRALGMPMIPPITRSVR
jgi:hypothetical protein